MCSHLFGFKKVQKHKAVKVRHKNVIQISIVLEMQVNDEYEKLISTWINFNENIWRNLQSFSNIYDVFVVVVGGLSRKYCQCQNKNADDFS